MPAAQTPETRGSAEQPPREISVSAAIALALASSRPQDGDRDRLSAGCRFAGTLRPGDAYWFSGHLFEPGYDPCPDHPDLRHQHMHRVIVVWGPRLDTTSDVLGRELIRFWIWDPATGNEGSATFGPRGAVRVDLDDPYWTAARGTLDQAAEKELAHHAKCECGTCRPDLAARHHPDCQCTGCQPGKWAPEARPEEDGAQ